MATLWVPVENIVKLYRDLRKVRKRSWVVKISRSCVIPGEAGYRIQISQYSDFDHIKSRWERTFGAVDVDLYNNRLVNYWG